MITQKMFQSRLAVETWSRTFAEYDGETARVLAKFRLYLDEADQQIASWLRSDGFWEAWITMAVAQAIHPGMHCLDIGANMGYYTALMADGVGANGRVLAVDANPKMIELLVASAHLNAWRNVDVIQRAVSDTNRKKVKLYIPETMSGGAAIRDDGTVEVQTATIDYLVKEWPCVDFIKMDIEGAEQAAWAGMQGTIENNPKIIIVMEVDARRYSDTAHSWFTEIAQQFPLRYVGYDGSIQSISVEQLVSQNDLLMLWLQK